jgi:carboxymethylenebutenolidase
VSSMHRLSLRYAALLVALAAGTANAGADDATGATARSHLVAQQVTLTSSGLSLVAFLYKPDGDGPFPALIWNHGSEKRPDRSTQFESVASIFVPAGYVVLAPVRRGHGGSEGHYIVNEIRQARFLEGSDRAARVAVRLLESGQLDDQLAGLDYVKRLPFVDPQRIAVAGCSYGGIQALLGAERGAGYRVAVSLSPAAQSWEGNLYLQRRLVQAVQRIDIPVLLLQPAKDASLEPSRVLGAAAAKAGTPLTAKVYPATGPRDAQGHCFGGAQGMHVWAEDAKAFIGSNLR